MKIDTRFNIGDNIYRNVTQQMLANSCCSIKTETNLLGEVNQMLKPIGEVTAIAVDKDSTWYATGNVHEQHYERLSSDDMVTRKEHVINTVLTVDELMVNLVNIKSRLLEEIKCTK